MYTIMYCNIRNELRLVKVDENGPILDPRDRFTFLPEHKTEPPLFENATDGWHYISEFYPELQP